jgi:hypothetical protein
MNGKNGIIGTVIVALLGDLIEGLTPAVKDELGKLLYSLHDKALATKNPIDDMATGFLLRLMGFEVPE